MLIPLKTKARLNTIFTNNDSVSNEFIDRFYLDHQTNYTLFNLTNHMLGFDILLGLFTQHGKLALLFKALTNMSQLCTNTPTSKFLTLPEVFL